MNELLVFGVDNIDKLDRLPPKSAVHSDKQANATAKLIREQPIISPNSRTGLEMLLVCPLGLSICS